MANLRRLLALNAAILSLLFLTGRPEATAQTACRTASCSSGAPASGCESRAAPRTARVLMTGSRGSSRFEPRDPKIEPGDCIEWMPSSTRHTSTGSGNPLTCTDTTCPEGLCQPPDCQWDTGDVLATDPSLFCFYDEAIFQPVTVQNFCCRIHFLGGMTGVLHVTSAINLSVRADIAQGDVVLDWTGGGVPGDETFVLVRSTDPAFPTASSIELNPAGGPTGRSFTDVGELNADRPTTFYLVRNRQSNELL